MDQEYTRLETVLRHDRRIVVGALVLITLIAWAYTLAGVGMEKSSIQMTALSREVGAMMMQPAEWTAGYALLIFLMWWIMMIAMMVPSAAPMVLLYAVLSRKNQRTDSPLVPTGIFLFGYLACWAAFSLIAASAQWALEGVGLLTPMMNAASGILGGAILLTAGVYQFTPFKHACLRHCRHPVHFISAHWRNGAAGAFRMGVEHGAYCLGCCWFLMCLLFVGGIMNFYWIAGIAIYVLAEKFIPHGHWLGNAAGVLLAVGGIWMLAGALA